ncbi:hypothetical protein ACFY36_03290 [Actinoplanes sp. NPDC000266]
MMESDALLPPGVANQVNFFLGGGGDCGEEATGEEGTGKPRIDGPSLVEIPDMPVFCLAGFRETGTITVTVTSPTARQMRNVQLQQLVGVPWLIPTGSPAGRYRIRVVQGGRAATSEFDVRRAARPRMWIAPRHVRAGETVDVHIGGFPPRRTTDLHLYVSDALTYRASTTVAVDGNGEALLTLRTSPGSKPDAYAVNSPLIYVPPDHFEPGELGGPPGSVFWIGF